MKVFPLKCFAVYDNYYECEPLNFNFEDHLHIKNLWVTVVTCTFFYYIDSTISECKTVLYAHT